MIPFRHADERIWHATHELRAQRRDNVPMRVHMHPEYIAWVRRDLMHWASLRTLADVNTVFGLPLEPDVSLGRGEIVLRYEVAA